jgi:hypothetical protein
VPATIRTRRCPVLRNDDRQHAAYSARRARPSSIDGAHRSLLTGKELVNWIALSQVHTGAVVRYHGNYLNGGAPIPRYLLPGLHFDALARAGLVSLGQPDHLRARNAVADRGRPSPI